MSDCDFRPASPQPSIRGSDAEPRGRGADAAPGGGGRADGHRRGRSRHLGGRAVLQLQGNGTPVSANNLSPKGEAMKQFLALTFTLMAVGIAARGLGGAEKI